METILPVLVTWLVTSVSFLVISRIPFIGVEIDSLPIGFISGAVLGIVSALVQLLFTALGIEILGGLAGFVIFVICFVITDKFVDGFQLKGFWAPVLGALALSVVSTLVYKLIYYIPGLAA